MTAEERRIDIAERSGVSSEMVRRVLVAARDSLKDSAKKGERGTLPGICTITVTKQSKIITGGRYRQYLKAKATISPAFRDEIEELPESDILNIREPEADESIRLTVIPSLQ